LGSGRDKGIGRGFHLRVALVLDIKLDVVFTHLSIWLGGQLHQGVEGKFQGGYLLYRQGYELVLVATKNRWNSK
jgi:hypothetical protein